MNVEFELKGSPIAVNLPEEEIRAALDKAVRTNEEFWKLVLDVAGHYQAERMKPLLEERKKQQTRAAMRAARLKHKS